MAGRKPVINIHTQPTMLGEMMEQGLGLLVFVAEHPPAAVNLYKHRLWCGGISRCSAINIQLLTRMGAVTNILHMLNARPMITKWL